MVYGILIPALWLVWAVTWAVTSSWVKPIAWSATWQEQLAYRVPLWLAALLLVVPHWPRPLEIQIIPHSETSGAVGALLTALGLGFAIWARQVLGRNWSSDVAVKEKHELIRSGPYALARHPIYTGMSLAFVGTAVAIGDWRAFIAAAIAIASFIYKLRLEERLMRETFGAEYDAYAGRVKALVPFLV